MSNKDKINSQDSSFNYKDIEEYSFEKHHKKIMSDSTSLISSSSEPESLTDSESGSYFRTKNRSAYKKHSYESEFPSLFPRSKSVRFKKSYSIDVVNEEVDAEDERDKDPVMLRKNITVNYFQDDILTKNLFHLQGLKKKNKLSTKDFMLCQTTVDLDPVAEVKEETDKPDHTKVLSSPRIKYLTDYREDTIAKGQSGYTNSFFHCEENEVIAEDNDENNVENEFNRRAFSVHLKIEDFIDKSDIMDDMNNDLIVDTLNVDPIKEEDANEEEYTMDRKISSTILPIADEFDIFISRMTASANHDILDEIKEEKEERDEKDN